MDHPSQGLNLDLMLIPEQVMDFTVEQQQQPKTAASASRPVGICALLQPGETLDPKSIDFSSLTIDKLGGKATGGGKKGSKKKQQQLMLA